VTHNRGELSACRYWDTADACDVLLDASSDEFPLHVCDLLAFLTTLRYWREVSRAEAQIMEPSHWPLGGRRRPDIGVPWAGWHLPGRQPVGLIVRRDLDGGTTTLLGHVLPADYPPTRGGTTMLGSIPSPSPLLLPAWTFIQPTVMTTWSQTASPAEQQRLDLAERELRDWYRDVLLGRHMNARPGPSRRNETAEELRARVVAAVRSLVEGGREVTQIEVAALLGWKREATLREHLRAHDLDWFEIKRSVLHNPLV